MSLKILFFIFLVPVAFLIIGIKTIPDYGINWDEPQHFNRGQAYLHYFLTGKTTYTDLPAHEFLDESVDFKDIRGKYADIYLESKKEKKVIGSGIRRSYYKSDVFNFEYFKKNDSGHPPANGILAAVSNKIFYEKLGITGDLEAYHLFEIFTAFLVVLAVSIFAYHLYGIFPAIIAGCAIALYPIFFAESHFNIKDPVLASLFGLTIISMYFGVIKNKKILIVVSAIFAGLSLGTKFNFLFIPFIILPWLLLHWWKTGRLKIVPKTASVLIIYPVIAVGVFYLLWPFLWFYGLGGLIDVFKYYAEEGLGSVEQLEKFKFFGFNLYPITWIIITTPIPLLILSFAGIFFMLKRIYKDKDYTSLLILLWLLIPILRVSIPNTTIYGGVRHIMEFIPALAISCGAGSKLLISSFSGKSRKIVIALISLGLIFVLFEIVKIHPNENVYFNQIIGGLEGAYAKKIPFAGNSFGNAYQQGIVWLNKNAEKNSKLGLPIGGTINLPRQNLRSDINLGNDNFSAFRMGGEYQIEMSHNGIPKDYFTYSYLENFLNPVYEVKVDNIPILKVWKNDPSYLKAKLPTEVLIIIDNLQRQGNAIEIDIEKSIYLNGLYMDYGTDDCIYLTDGFISVSEDGTNWTRLPEPLSYPQISPSMTRYENKDFFFLFAGLKSRFIKITVDNTASCLYTSSAIGITGYEERPF